MNQVMKKERLGAFMDAVLAIIMTILVLELEKPETLDVAGLWALRENFFAYALSFFWLGAMWVNLHRGYEAIEKISQKTVWAAILILFFSSLFPYATRLISLDFTNATVQVFYGIISLLVTASVLWYNQTLLQVNPDNGAVVDHQTRRSRWIYWDIALKIMGIVLSATIFPPAMAWAILVTLCGLVIPHQFRS